MDTSADFTSIVPETKLSTYPWKVGDLIDLLDYNDVFCPAKILQVDGDRSLVTYVGW